MIWSIFEALNGGILIMGMGGCFFGECRGQEWRRYQAFTTLKRILSKIISQNLKIRRTNSDKLLKTPLWN